MLNKNVSTYVGVKGYGKGVATLQQITEQIRTVKPKGFENVRNLSESLFKAKRNKKGSKDFKEAYNEAKKDLPSFTTSGVFKGGRRKDLFPEATPSGFVILDFDEIESKEQTEELKKKAFEHPSVAVAFVSPSGYGFKLFIRCDVKNDEENKLAFAELEKEFKVKVDESGKDISRLCFFSYDPNILVKESVEPFKYSKTAKVKEKPKPKPKSNRGIKKGGKATKGELTTSDKIDLCIANLNGKDISEGYSNWLNIAFALENEFGEAGRDYFHQLSSNSSEYDRAKTDKQFDNALKGGGSGITINTLFNLFDENGVDWVRLQREINSAVHYSKQGSNNNVEATLAKVNGITTTPNSISVAENKTEKKKKPTLFELSKMFTETHNLKRSTFGNRLFLGVNKSPLIPITDDSEQSALGYFEQRNGFRLKVDEVKFVLKNNEVGVFNPFQYFLDEPRERKKGMLDEFIKAMNIQPQFLGEDDFDASTNKEIMMLLKWLTGIYNSAINGEKNDLILALYGKKQGEGKTTLINALFSDERLNFLFGATTIEDTDDFKRQSCYNLLILDDENKSGKKADIEGLKKLSGAESFTIVDKFEKHSKILKRNASFCICTNEKNILKDPTGNRRFMPIEVGQMDIGFLKTEFCPFSFWHDVKEYSLREGWHSYISKEELEGLEEYFGRFFETSLEGELIETKCIPCEQQDGMNTMELIRGLELANYNVYNKKAFTQALNMKGYEYKNTRHKDGKQRKVWNCCVV